MSTSDFGGARTHGLSASCPWCKEWNTRIREEWKREEEKRKEKGDSCSMCSMCGMPNDGSTEQDLDDLGDFGGLDEEGEMDDSNEFDFDTGGWDD